MWLPFGARDQDRGAPACGASPGNRRAWGGVGGWGQRLLKVSVADRQWLCVPGSGQGRVAGSGSSAGTCRPVWECKHVTPYTAHSPMGGSLTGCAHPATLGLELRMTRGSRRPGEALAAWESPEQPPGPWKNGGEGELPCATDLLGDLGQALASLQASFPHLC